MIEIYMLTHTTLPKAYVGMTSKKRYGNGILISNVKAKYGQGGFIPTILAKTECKDEADRLERFYISLFNTLHPSGYNLALGGEGGSIHTPEIKKQVSETLKANYQRDPSIATRISAKLKGRVSPNRGRKMSDSAKQKISEKASMFRHSEDTKQLMREKMTGRTFSEETRRKMSDSATKRAATEQGRANLEKARHNSPSGKQL